jgi:hypothetical protein
MSVYQQLLHRSSSWICCQHLHNQSVQVTAATCFAAGTATISNYSEDYTYTFDPTGPTAGTGGVISGFSTDVSYTVTATSSSNCTSEASELFMVPAALDAPMQPTVQVLLQPLAKQPEQPRLQTTMRITATRYDPTGPLAGANGVISNMTYYELHGNSHQQR